jgi:hypothetical protein
MTTTRKMPRFYSDACLLIDKFNIFISFYTKIPIQFGGRYFVSYVYSDLLAEIASSLTSIDP